MEPRRTRSSLISPSLKPLRNTRMVKSTRVPTHELAKLKASKPMLVIPQPVLRIHECLDDNVRMAQVESNAYIALGIKEEPIDEEYDAEGRHYEEANFAPMESLTTEEFYNQDNGYEEMEGIEGMRTTRASKRRMAGLIENTVNKEDDNNNSNKKTNKRKSSKEKKDEVNSGFHPIVLSVESLAVPREVQVTTIDNPDLNPSISSTPSVVETNSVEAAEGNNNIEKQFVSENDIPEDQLSLSLQGSLTVTKKSSHTMSSDSIKTDNGVKILIDIQSEKSIVRLDDCTLNPLKTVPVPALPEDAVKENDSSLSPIMEDEEEEEDENASGEEEQELEEEPSSSSEEESEAEITRKIQFVLIVLLF